MNDNRSSGPGIRKARLLAQADLCVKCGLCLPHCPTYRLVGMEGESPRGRIALIQGLASGGLARDPVLEGHLENCLTCRTCERVCPSGVPYGQLIDGARQELTAGRRGNPLAGWIRSWVVRGPVEYPAMWLWLSRLVRWASTPLPGLARWSWGARLARLARYRPRSLPDGVRAWPSRTPAAASRGRVQLFLGCVARDLDRPVLEAAAFLLNRLGYSVDVPSRQACCGAIHLHAGDADAAQGLARRNVQAFGAGDGPPLVTCASGCGGTLTDYGGQSDWWADTHGIGGFSERVMDISSFLVGADWPDGARPEPLHGLAVVHDPCTLGNVMGQSEGPYQLLERIPALRVLPLAPSLACCGSAGIYMLEHPEASDRLADLMVDALPGDADWLVTSNVGCALHLRARLRARGREIEVVHPVVLLARQLNWPGC